jgi:hypothetical protein
MIERLKSLKNRIIKGETTMEDVDVINDVINTMESLTKATVSLDESAEEILPMIPSINIENIYISLTNDEERGRNKNEK